MPTTYQLLITLQYVQPTIWRRILVDSSIKLSDLHKVLQTTMGWTDSHLHQFTKNGKNYAHRSPDDDFWDKSKDVDYKKWALNDLLVAENDSMEYCYDFGDDWIHTIQLERIGAEGVKTTCLDGVGCCPPENVGGAGGYEELLQILKDPKHPEYQDYVAWLGKPFHPEAFDAAEVTAKLRSRNFGRQTWEEIVRDNFFGTGKEPDERFDGLTPAEMNTLVGAPYGDFSPIEIKPLQPEILASIPILNLSKFLLEYITTAGELKLTPKGFLPEKLLMAMYLTGYIAPRYPKNKPTKFREEDDKSFQFTRALLEQSGLIKKRNNKLSPTKTGLKLCTNDAALFRQLLETCSSQFDWSNMDGFENNDIGVYGLAFVVKLLSKYGSEKRLPSFYAEKYFKAFPWLVATRIHSYFNDPIRYSNHCFEHRALEVILSYFGFVTFELIPGAPYEANQVVVRTDLFDKVFKMNEIL